LSTELRDLNCFIAYVALDTGFDKTGNFPMKNIDELKNYALYVLYLLFPLVAIVAFFLLEAFLVLRVLGELMPMGKLLVYIYPQLKDVKT